MERSEKTGKKLVAYTDESGNTGNNLFDPAQPWFWTGTLLVDEDFEQAAKPYVEGWCERLSVSELHGTDIGLQGLERIPHAIDVLVRRQDAHFIFTRVQKSHLAATKFTDTFLDSGNNKAVSPLHYGTRLFRIRFAALADHFMQPRDREEFWEAYTRRDHGKFCSVAQRFNDWVQAHTDLDARTKQILGDALAWAIEHPESVLPTKANVHDAPNAVGLQLLMYSLHTTIGDVGARITRFLHDETNQFANAIKTEYGVLSILGHQSLLPQAQISDYTQTEVFECPIQMVESKEFAGLQLVDVTLWLVKKGVEGGLTGFPDCQRLIRTLNSRSTVCSFSTEEMQEQSAAMCKEVMDAGELTDEQYDQTKEILDHLEQKRQVRMREPT